MGVSWSPIYQTQPNFTRKKLTKNRAASPEPKAGQLNAGLGAFWNSIVLTLIFKTMSFFNRNKSKICKFMFICTFYKCFSTKNKAASDITGSKKWSGCSRADVAPLFDVWVYVIVMCLSKRKPPQKTSLVNGKPSKSLSPQQAAGHYGILPLRVQVCSHISSGLRPAEPSFPAIHPTNKLAGILAYEISSSL